MTIARMSRADLRESLNVDDDSPVRPRTIRNHFEHFDEWISVAAKSGFFIDSNIGAKERLIVIDGAPAPDQLYLRHYDPDTDTVTFWDDAIALGPVVAELERLEQTAAPDG